LSDLPGSFESGKSRRPSLNTSNEFSACNRMLVR
jgi:hypothetical protein